MTYDDISEDVSALLKDLHDPTLLLTHLTSSASHNASVHSQTWTKIALLQVVSVSLIAASVHFIFSTALHPDHTFLQWSVYIPLGLTIGLSLIAILMLLETISNLVNGKVGDTR